MAEQALTSSRESASTSPFGAGGAAAVRLARSRARRAGGSTLSKRWVIGLSLLALAGVATVVVLLRTGVIGSGRVRVSHAATGVSLEMPKSWTVHRDVARHQWVMPLFARNSDEMQFRLVRTRVEPKELFEAEKPWIKTGERRIRGVDARWIAVDDPLTPNRREIQYALRRGDVTYWLSFSVGQSRFREYEPIFHQVAQSLRFSDVPKP